TCFSDLHFSLPSWPSRLRFLSFHFPPREGAGGAPIGARMLRLHPVACMTARGLSLSRREPGAGATRRRASRRSTVTFFGPGPAFCYRSSLDQAAMAALGVVPPGVLGVVLPGTVANRSGDATPCSAFPVRLSRRLPSMSKAGATYK